MYAAVIAFLGPYANQIQLEMVGVFPSEKDAENAIQNFIDSVLEVERPDYSGLVKKIFFIGEYEEN